MNDAMAQDQAYIDRELEDLRFHWGSAYLLQCPRMGLWIAYRRDDMTMIEAPDPERLLELVRGNYLANPVPRQGGTYRGGRGESDALPPGS